ncbi:MAG: S46 family peptidase [Bacteroidia bacterium]
MIKNALRISTIFVLFTAFLAKASSPDEGMWLPLYLKSLNEKDMKAHGLKLTADDIYNINKSSLKDAVVQLGNFCTGEIVSAEGLMLTNHHCGYDKIADHSSEKNNYLRDGFWAKTKADELPNPGLTASILVRMEDVTDVMKKKTALTDQPEMQQVYIKMAVDSITQAATAGTHYKAEIKEFFKGNEYYLLVYEVFKDVRLVGAPPSSVGKYGGDTDNWMWPRHTGDFSIFRIYAGKDGKPAPYSKDNVPYKPKQFFNISLKGVEKEDYTMIIGFPGSTDRYLTSYDLETSRDYTNPAVVEALGTRLEIMKAEMDASEAVKIALAGDYASMSNSHKYTIGQQRQLKQGGAIVEKKQDEEAFMKWVNADNARKEKYGNVLQNIKNAQEQYKTIEPGISYLFYGVYSGPVKHAFSYYSFYRMHSNNEKGKPTQAQLDSLGAKLLPVVQNYHRSSNKNVDKKVMKATLKMMYNGMEENKRPAILNTIVKQQKKAKSPEEAIDTYVDNIYATSFLTDSTAAYNFLKKPNYKKKLEKDPLYKLMVGLIQDYYFASLAVVHQQSSGAMEDEHKKYIEGLREWKKDKVFYPDANSTLRVTYGNVKPYFPRDGVFYDYYTTHEGIIEKYDPKDDEFNAPSQLIEMLKKKQFGRYGQKDTLRVNFLSNNDITGGNSGSPVLNANGELVGIAFDGNWESMIGDLYVNPALNRTISVDIRYVLWVIDEFANADHLIKEMVIKE